MSLSRPLPFLPPTRREFSISAVKFQVPPGTRSGHNQIYESKRSKSYFFELVHPDECTNYIHLKIHTNDHHMDRSPFKYISTCHKPNHKYQINKMLTHFFTLQKVIPRSIQNKFFTFLSSKLLDRVKIVASRIFTLLGHHRFRTTKTFFRFTYKKFRFNFGIYLPCSYGSNLSAYKHTYLALYRSKGLEKSCYRPRDKKNDDKMDRNLVTEWKNVIIATGKCRIPSPVVYRNFCSCVIHEPRYNRAITNFRNPMSHESHDQKRLRLLANQKNINDDHSSATQKDVFSLRLGTSYRTTKTFTDSTWLRHTNGCLKRPIYGKLFSDYKIHD